MTVQELIDKLMEVEDKSTEVCVPFHKHACHLVDAMGGYEVWVEEDGEMTDVEVGCEEKEEFDPTGCIRVVEIHGGC